MTDEVVRRTQNELIYAAMELGFLYHEQGKNLEQARFSLGRVLATPQFFFKSKTSEETNGPSEKE